MVKTTVKEISIHLILNYKIEIMRGENEDYIGVMQEIPMGIQAKTKNEIYKNMKTCLEEFIKNEPEKAVPILKIKNAKFK